MLLASDNSSLGQATVRANSTCGMTPHALLQLTCTCLLSHTAYTLIACAVFWGRQWWCAKTSNAQTLLL